MNIVYRKTKTKPLTYDEMDSNFKSIEEFYDYQNSYKTIEIKDDDAVEISLDISEHRNFLIKTHVNLNIKLIHEPVDFDCAENLTIAFDRTANAMVSIEGDAVINDSNTKLIKVSVFMNKNGHRLFF